jgi:hypothetical protein
VFEAVVEKTQRALGWSEVSREAGVRTGTQAQPEPPSAPAGSTPMSLAEQLELRSNEVAERLDREAHPQRERGMEDDAFRHQPGHDAAGRQPFSADYPTEPGGRRAIGAEAEGGGEVAPQRLQPSDGANELTLEEQLHARADEVARRVEQELAQDSAARARAEVERQRALQLAEEQKRGRGRSRGRFLGDDDDEFTRGRGR